MSTSAHWRAGQLGVIVSALLALGLAGGVAPIPGGEKWISTEYSSVILREKGSVRTLYFVRDSGEQVVESAMNLLAPHRLVLPYTQSMFASYLFVPEPKKVLIVGLGAGSMVRFLEYYERSLEIVSIDIDPVMLKIAKEYFGTQPSKRVRLLVADGFAYIREEQETFDVIYMDAFLKPSDATDSVGVPLAMKTREFYRNVQERLTSRGVVVFNLNPHDDVVNDVAEIQASFPGVFVFRVPDSSMLIAVASKAKKPPAIAELRLGATEAERRLGSALPFRRFLDDLQSYPEIPASERERTSVTEQVFTE